MASGVALSRVQYPLAAEDADVANRGQAVANSGKVSLGSLARSMRGVWPAVDAVNGPLLADAGHTQTAPDFTGMREVPWNTAGAFNKQSQNWLTVPNGNGPSTGAACQNTMTDRGNFGSSGIGTPCHTDFSFVTDSAKIIIKYYVNPTGMAVTTSYHETQIFAELQGQMKGIRIGPAMTAAGAGTGVYYRVITMSEARSREIIAWLSANCWLMSVYVETGSNITAAPNRPVLELSFGNSWGEPNGNVFSFFGGNGAIAGVGFTNASLLYSCVPLQRRLTHGFAEGLCNQGGTQWVTNNGGISRDEAVAKGFSPTLSTNQVNYAYSIFGDRYPTINAGGNYNDGDAPVAGSGTTLRDNYRDVVTYALDKTVNKWGNFGTDAVKSKVPIILLGGEPKFATAGSPRDYTNQGIKAAGVARPNNVIGTIDFFLMWQGDITSKLGPDGLHPKINGAEAAGDMEAKLSFSMLVDQSWVNRTLAAVN